MRASQVFQRCLDSVLLMHALRRQTLPLAVGSLLVALVQSLVTSGTQPSCRWRGTDERNAADATAAFGAKDRANA